MTRRLILCLDGTWNDYEDHTNVARMHAAIPSLPGAAGERVQLKYYDSGVGSHLHDRIVGGVGGIGLAENIRQAYRWLVGNYRDGDELYLFGFSRGAYTARSLAGLIQRCGIPPPPADPTELMALSQRVWRIYRGSREDNEEARSFRASESRVTRIHFLGVWETVGALGTPFIDLIERFHDTRLGGVVSHAYHALAIDEQRPAFEAVLWSEKPETCLAMEQRWFPGAHANVGGGYRDDPLPNLSLNWMAARARECGLRLDDEVLQPSGDELLAPIRDSYAEFPLKGLQGSRHYRVIGAMPGEIVDPSAYEKMRVDAAYRPVNLPPAT